MYLEHFKLKELPFALTPKTRYFYKLSGQHAAFNVLLLHLRNGEGFIKITGEIGSGKTLLCRLLLENIGNDFFTAYIPNPDLEPNTLRKALAQELGITEDYLDDQHRLMTAITKRLMELHQSGKRVALIIDEAQALPIESLETLRLFTNLETESTKLLQVVLFGQPELDQRLNTNAMRQLKQRIGFSYRLPLLQKHELEAYINHRLSAAGYQGLPLFTRSARMLLFCKSKGVPRLINILCHKAMMYAYGQGKHYVTYQAIKAAVKDTEAVVTVSKRWINIFLGIGLALVCTFIIFFWYFFKTYYKP